MSVERRSWLLHPLYNTLVFFLSLRSLVLLFSVRVHLFSSALSSVIIFRFPLHSHVLGLFDSLTFFFFFCFIVPRTYGTYVERVVVLMYLVNTYIHTMLASRNRRLSIQPRV